MGKRFDFDVNKAIPMAWEMQWANNLKQRKEDLKYEKKLGKKPFNWARTYYLTASDIENQVREFAVCSRDGKPWDKAILAFGKPMAWPPIRISGNLKGAVRDWLLRGNGGKIVGHNFGRGHISGMRFRPVGQPLAEAEIKTIDKLTALRNGTAPPKPVHFNDKGLLCQKARKKSFSFYRRSRTRVRTTEDHSKVTCKQCLNLLTKMPRPYNPPGSVSHMADDNTHD